MLEDGQMSAGWGDGVGAEARAYSVQRGYSILRAASGEEHREAEPHGDDDSEDGGRETRRRNPTTNRSVVAVQIEKQAPRRAGDWRIVLGGGEEAFSESSIAFGCTENRPAAAGGARGGFFAGVGDESRHQRSDRRWDCRCDRRGEFSRAV